MCKVSNLGARKSHPTGLCGDSSSGLDRTVPLVLAVAAWSRTDADTALTRQQLVLTGHVLWAECPSGIFYTFLNLHNNPVRWRLFSSPLSPRPQIAPLELIFHPCRTPQQHSGYYVTGVSYVPYQTLPGCLKGESLTSPSLYSSPQTQ